MKCDYCNITNLTSRGRMAHAKDMVIKDEIHSCEPITVSIRNDLKLHVETKVDDLYAVIKIKFCPMCGAKLN